MAISWFVSPVAKQLLGRKYYTRIMQFWPKKTEWRDKLVVTGFLNQRMLLVLLPPLPH